MSGERRRDSSGPRASGDPVRVPNLLAGRDAGLIASPWSFFLVVVEVQASA